MNDVTVSRATPDTLAAERMAEMKVSGRGRGKGEAHAARPGRKFKNVGATRRFEWSDMQRHSVLAD